MTTTTNLSSRRGPVGEDVRSLADIARQLAAISERLAARAGDEEGEELRAVSQALSRTAQDMEAAQVRAEQQQRLRREVLEVLAKRGSLLTIELEAATLSLPDELAPVLQSLVDEGLVEVQPIQGGEVASLTRKGREALRR